MVQQQKCQGSPTENPEYVLFWENTCFKFFGKAQVLCRCCLQLLLGQVQHVFSIYE